MFRKGKQLDFLPGANPQTSCEMKTMTVVSRQAPVIAARAAGKAALPGAILAKSLAMRIEMTSRRCSRAFKPSDVDYFRSGCGIVAP